MKAKQLPIPPGHAHGYNKRRIENHKHPTGGSSFSHIHTIHYNDFPHAGDSVSIEVDLNPDINIEVTKQGFYRALKRPKDAENHCVEICLPEPWFYGHNAREYIGTLDIDQLVAAQKIFFDRWSFVTGNEYDKDLYEAAEHEIEHRRNADTNRYYPSHAHAISNFGSPSELFDRTIPAHSHGPGNNTSGIARPGLSAPIWQISAE